MRHGSGWCVSGMERTIIDRRQTKVCAHQVLLAALELADLPDDGILLGRVRDLADAGLELGRVNIARHRNDDLDVVGRGALLEL